MDRRAGRPKAGQESLTPERILTVALRLVDEGGMEALSMRRLAAELGVDPMAIYYHLPNKRAILSGLVARVFAELRVPSTKSGRWPERVRAIAQAYHGLARAHPNLVFYLVTDRESAAVAALELNEALFEALTLAGLSPQMIVPAADLIVDYVNGFALAEASGPVGQPAEWRELSALLDRHPPNQFPSMRYVFGNLAGQELPGSFDIGLDIILAGIKAIAGKEAGLIWEGDPQAEDGQAQCASLRLAAEGPASLGPCGSAAQTVELLAVHQTTWADILARFAPFEVETEDGRIVFQGHGAEASPAWQNAITTWARFTYLELSSGRVGAANRTVMSWWLGELPEQPGFCRQLVVLNYGYAYTNITPCEGGQVKETNGGWLETAEWEQFDTWLNTQAPLYQENNYFSGLGAEEMSEAEAAALGAWAEAVYARLQPK